MIEKWKDVVGYEGKYQVSNLGRVKTLEHFIEFIQMVNSQHMIKPVKTKMKRKVKPRMKKLSVGNHGYHVVNLGLCDTHCVHVLVAKAFLKKTKTKNHVDHLNNKRTDSRVNNLEWVSQLENNRRQFKRLKNK